MHGRSCFQHTTKGLQTGLVDSSRNAKIGLYDSLGTEGFFKKRF
jgi:hypothetical protein